MTLLDSLGLRFLNPSRESKTDMYRTPRSEL